MVWRGPSRLVGTRPYEAGVTLIDTLIATALLLAVFLGIFGAVQLSLDVALNNKARAGAIALMNERMEYVRSLEYASVGTVGGIPSGPIPQSEAVEQSGVTYTRRTTIQYVDDPEDGENQDDANDIIVDYKQVRIEISWQSRTGERRVYMAARVEPLSGMEVDCDSPCGTLRVDVLDANSEPVPSAQVEVVNSSLTPEVDITTFTNEDGRVVLAGAPVASGYKVSVSKAGYNSAETLASSADNPNPTPSDVSVAQNQTSSLTFGLPNSGIDRVSTKILYTLSAPEAAEFEENFADASGIASSTGIAVASGAAQLEGDTSYAEWGELEGDLVVPSSLGHWERFTWSGTTPAGTSAVLRFLDADGALIPDAALPGNAAGFTAQTVNLYDLSTTAYPSIAVRATLTGNGSSTPSIASYRFEYLSAPAAVASVPLEMRGTKQIGTDPIIYKYDHDDLQTDASGQLELQNLEWDTYSATSSNASGYALAYACAPQPEYLPPATTQTTRLYLTQAGAGLGFVVSNADGDALTGAAVELSNSTYAATTTTDSCGIAYFAGLSAGSYAYRLSATGYAATSSSAAVSALTTIDVELAAQ